MAKRHVETLLSLCEVAPVCVATRDGAVPSIGDR